VLQTWHIGTTAFDHGDENDAATIFSVSHLPGCLVCTGT
jgi:hypothetical protein